MVIQAPAVSNVHSAIRQIYPRLLPSSKKRKEAKGKKTNLALDHGEKLGKGDKVWRKRENNIANKFKSIVNEANYKEKYDEAQKRLQEHKA